MEPETLTAIVGLGGVVVGGITTFSGSFLLSWLQKREEKKAISSAILSEIRTTLQLVEARQYIEGIKEILRQLEEDEINSSTFEVIVPDDYCIIYKNNVDKIGLLPDSIRDNVVMFYQLLEAIICDVKPGGRIAAQQSGTQEFDELLRISAMMIALGEELIAQPADSYNVG